MKKGWFNEKLKTLKDLGRRKRKCLAHKRCPEIHIVHKSDLRDEAAKWVRFHCMLSETKKRMGKDEDFIACQAQATVLMTFFNLTMEDLE